MSFFLLLLLLSLLGSAEGFVVRLPLTRRSCRDGAGGAAVEEDDITLNSSIGESLYPGDEAPLLAINETLRVDVSTLAERKQPPSPYQITRPRWYNKAEVAIIVLLCQRLRMLDLKGVERMLDDQKSFSKEAPVSLLVLARVFCRMNIWTQLLLHVDGNNRVARSVRQATYLPPLLSTTLWHIYMRWDLAEMRHRCVHTPVTSANLFGRCLYACWCCRGMCGRERCSSWLLCPRPTSGRSSRDIPG